MLVDALFKGVKMNPYAPQPQRTTFRGVRKIISQDMTFYSQTTLLAQAHKK